MKQSWREYLSTLYRCISTPPRFPPGHYYSPLLSAEERKNFRLKPDALLTGVDLQLSKQRALLEDFKPYYADIPFSEQASGKTRYHFDNGVFCHADGVFLYSMMRHLRPRRIVEVGSGLSSALMLDTNELFFNSEIKLCFIDPSFKRLRRHLRSEDWEKHSYIESRVQDVSPDVFSELGENDILFIDSSHVAKLGSDVNYLLFEILPLLQRGVMIHFHDIFFPFEYPEAWVKEGVAWNEAYLLRAFLLFNSDFEVSLFSTLLQKKYPEVFSEHFPICAKNTGGSLWIQRKLR